MGVRPASAALMVLGVVFRCEIECEVFGGCEVFGITQGGRDDRECVMEFELRCKWIIWMGAGGPPLFV